MKAFRLEWLALGTCRLEKFSLVVSEKKIGFLEEEFGDFFGELKGLVEEIMRLETYYGEGVDDDFCAGANRTDEPISIQDDKVLIEYITLAVDSLHKVERELSAKADRYEAIHAARDES